MRSATAPWRASPPHRTPGAPRETARPAPAGSATPAAAVRDRSGASHPRPRSPCSATRRPEPGPRRCWDRSDSNGPRAASEARRSASNVRKRTVLRQMRRRAVTRTRQYASQASAAAAATTERERPPGKRVRERHVTSSLSRSPRSIGTPSAGRHPESARCRQRSIDRRSWA